MSDFINQEERAYRAWNILVNCASQNKKITYKDIASFLNLKHHRPVRYFLDIIQNYCLNEKLPPLTILVVNQSGFPGQGFIAWDVNNFDEGIKLVYEYNWKNIPNPFEYAKTGDTYSDFVNKLISIPESSQDIYSKIKVRGIAQQIFREALLEVYGKSCAVCGITFEEALEATHIIPWSKCNTKDRLNINNGILLCSLHHKLFDSGLLTVTSNYKIKFLDGKSKIKNLTKYDTLFTLDLQDKNIRLPNDRLHWPKIEFIEEHNKMT